MCECSFKVDLDTATLCFNLLRDAVTETQTIITEILETHYIYVFILKGNKYSFSLYLLPFSAVQFFKLYCTENRWRCCHLVGSLKL